jgi:hypothetical protein
MSESEIDSAIAALGPSLEEAVERLRAGGEPALVRLLQVMEGTFRVPFGKSPIDDVVNRQVALGVLSGTWPDTVLALIDGGRLKFTMSMLLGLKMSRDSRVKQVASEALKAGRF